MPNKRTIFYSTPGLSSFSVKDIEILKESFEVKVFLFNPSKKIITPFFLFKQFLSIIFNFRTHIFLTQFGGYHSLIPGIIGRLTGRKSYIITGGTDCVSFPRMAYGNFSKKLLGIVTCFSYRLSNKIFPVHASLVQVQNDYDPEQAGPQGMLQFCRNLTTPYKVIHNGYDGQIWRKKAEKDPFSFITVAAGVVDYKRFVLKGIDLIFEIAPKFPHCKFTIVGCTKFNFQIDIPTNIVLIDFADQDQLIELFSRHSFYLQLSVSEGFPNAICEAMLCECIPLGSNVGALPLIIGNSGLILGQKDIKLLERIFQNAMSLPEEAAQLARERIIQNFNINKRKAELISALS